ncbi:MAG TPA: FG-GAP-like repeat-containing protein [Pyrinomonadaceae bacterium]|nr:FG-GAP-like repeat-containing protein [Pyrinomonadaceae bacterium]
MLRHNNPRLPLTLKISLLTLFTLLQLLTSVDVSAQCNPSVFSSTPRYAADQRSRSVAVAEFNADGKLDLAVVNFQSNDVSILFGDGFGGFGPPTHVPVNPEPSVVAAGDFNKDGKTDLAVGYFFFRPISVLLGNGDGTFSGPTTVGNSANASDLAVADFNNDGNPDIAVASAGDQMILLGNGSGAFTTKEISVGSGATSVAAGDINGDGIQDAAFTPNGAANWKVALVLGNAAGTFSVNASFTVEQAPTAIAIGNFNADSQPDLLLTVDWFEPRVMLFLNQGNNNFTLSTQFFAGREPRDVTAGDFNGDGKLDAAASLSGAHGVAIALGNGLGGFSAPTFFGAGTQPWSIGAGDFNADGKLDLVTSDDPSSEVAPFATGGVSVLLGTGTGTFQSYRSYAYPFTPQFVLSPTSIAAGEFNNNNRPDLAVGFSSVPYIAIMLDDGQGEFIQPGSFLDAGGSVASLAISDLNNDGKADLITANSNTANISIFFGFGNGSFMPRVQIPVNANPSSVAVGDFNGDGKRDLIVTHENPAAAVILLGDGNGGFTQPGGSPQPVVQKIAIGDFNGDGRSDVAAGNSPQNNVAIFLADATGHLNLASTTPSVSVNTEMRLQTADLNADNKLDLVVANVDRNTITVFLGNGAGGLSAGTNFDAEPRPLDPTIADFDGNGTLDVVVGNNGLSFISFYAGNGAGGLNAPVSYAAGPNPNGLAKGDFNQDNKTDLAVLTGTSFGLSILKNVTAPLPCLSVNDVTVTEGDTGSTNLDFVITLSQASSETVRVNYSLFNETATKGADFANLSSRLTFAPGETTKTISIPVFGDLLDEVDETFLLQLGSASGANISDAQGRGTILDNDPTPSISINDISNDEATLLRNFTVTLSAVSGRDVKVDFATANGTATAGVSGTNDYLATSGTLTIPAGQSSGQISVLVFDDDTFEPDETYFVNLTNPVNATITDAQGQSTIVNNDPVPSVNVQDAFVTEGNAGNTEMSFTVFLSNPTFLPVTVDFATSNETAIAGSDYVATTGHVTFAPGETQKSVVVPVIGDTVDETAESFFLNISNAQNASLGSSNARGLILDDDGPNISINDVTVGEGNSGTRAATFTLTLSAPSVETVFVRATTAGATATAFSDYNGLNLNISIPAGTVSKTFNVTILGDTNPESDETFFVNLSDVFGATLADPQALGTIIDDDSLRLTVEQTGPDPQHAVAFDSFLFVRDPFHVRSIGGWLNSLPDPNTRLLVFAAGLQLNAGEPASAVVVNLVDSSNQSLDVPAEDVRALGTSGFTQVVFRLPDGLAPGVCKVTIKAHSQTSNVGNIVIAP